MSERFEVVVVGSGAGGGVVAGELAERGRDVLLLETGPHRTAADFTRFEAKATHDLFWPIRFAYRADGPPVVLLAGRCVGGTTTINTKVALRAGEHDLRKWHDATGLTNEHGEPFSTAELAPFYDRVEQRLGVRERNDWTKSVRTVQAGFAALGKHLESVTSYTDANCMRCGSCLQGCPTNAGKSTQNTYIHDAWAREQLDLRANANVERVLVDGGEATGVEYTDAAGKRHVVGADAVVVAGGALNTPQLLLRSGLGGGAIGRHLGLHPVRIVCG
ncbi:MAG TPA: GMC family oxidoreductase N-terminal domain-containing protein, partial [Gaiellaceae bacterium]